MRTYMRWLPLVLFPVLAVGCSDGLNLVPVSGKVTFKGKALGNVKVEFHPDPDTKTVGPSSNGVTDKDGNFTLVCNNKSKSPGAVVGHHRIVLNDLDIYGTVFVGRGDYRSEDPKGPKEVPKFARFPATYSDLANTPFKLEVKPGMSPVNLDLKR